jgi:hypothetical protein
MDNDDEFWTTEEVPLKDPDPTKRDLARALAELDSTHGSQWVYRGQSSGWGLTSTLERHCRMSKYQLADAPGIEAEMIRHFKRLYDGDDRRDVVEDTLYCISLMRHFGAPTRVLDFTYSKDVATYFALECAYDTVPGKSSRPEEPDYEKERTMAVWCIDTSELRDRIKRNNPEVYFYTELLRVHDEMRTDVSFLPLYMENRHDFVCTENPLRLHERLDIQHGVFLCPGNVGRSFMDNLAGLVGDKNRAWIYKFVCRLTPQQLQGALDEFRTKTITRQSLLPGLDGFAQSMKYQLALFKQLYINRGSAYGSYPQTG